MPLKKAPQQNSITHTSSLSHHGLQPMLTHNARDQWRPAGVERVGD
jgi:hypothetical protein